jgi:hypothetical protein
MCKQFLIKRPWSKIDPHSIIPLLCSIACNDDEDPYVREEATKALDQLHQSHSAFIPPWLTFESEKKHHNSEREMLPPKKIELEDLHSILNGDYLRETKIWRLQNYDLSDHLDLLIASFNSYELATILSSTTLESILKSRRTGLSRESAYVTTIKCVQENLPFFIEDSCLCFYQQDKFYKTPLIHPDESIELIQALLDQYHNFTYIDFKCSDKPQKMKRSVAQGSSSTRKENICIVS